MSAKHGCHCCNDFLIVRRKTITTVNQHRQRNQIGFATSKVLCTWMRGVAKLSRDCADLCLAFDGDAAPWPYAVVQHAAYFGAADSNPLGDVL